MRKNSLIKKTNLDNTIGHIDVLITRVKDIEEQIANNSKQPIHDYEKLIHDCQVSFTYFIYYEHTEHNKISGE